MNRALSHLIFGLNVLLSLACVFQDKLLINSYIKALGSLHPMVLHLPIGFLFLLVLLYFLQSRIEKKSYQFLFGKLLQLTALVAVITALGGVFLASDQSLELSQHKYSGLAVSWCTYIVYQYQYKFFSNTVWANTALALLAFCTIIAGHLGASLTHGPNFLFAQNTEIENKNTVFAAVIQPIFEQKCLSCHNATKAKGGLNLSNWPTIIKGGKTGKLFVPKDSVNSLILKVLTMPTTHKKHMPPKEKPQLTANELITIKHWIAEGALPNQSLVNIPKNSFFANLRLIQPSTSKKYDFKPASESTIAKLNTPYCNVTAIAQQLPALKAEFFVSSQYKAESLKALNAIKKQLVSLNLAKMPVNDEVFGIIASFEALEVLNLNQTKITGRGIEKLKSCKNLRQISIANNQLEKGVLLALEQLPSLQKVFLWESGLNKTNVLQSSKKTISYDFGYQSDSTEILKLNPAMLLANKRVYSTGEKPILKHSLKNVKIRYSTDSAKLDSAKGKIYTQAIDIDGYTRLQTIATKPGWRASDVKIFGLFKSGILAQNATLLQKADSKYPGTGAAGLIDGKAGDIVNFKDKTWLAVRDNDFAATITFKQNTRLQGLSVSFGNQPGSHIMPPLWLEVYLKKGREFVLLQKIYPPQDKKLNPGEVQGINIALGKQVVEEIKIIAKPLPKLPNWHPNKGDKVWFFIDEVYFY
jgi:hypothetical protein